MTIEPFKNEPLLELRRRDIRESLADALGQLDARLPVSAPLLVGDEQVQGDALISSDPGLPERIVALAPMASESDVRQAVQLAAAAAPDWARTPGERRAQALLGAAAWMRARRHELAALCVRECAKPWSEADADVAEAIDFLEYYARGAMVLAGGAGLLQVPGERNTMRYAARGVCAVIAPWNFPLAIPTGMLSAALVTGNAALLKPAEQAPGCGAMVVQALRAGGVPAAVVGLLTGAGEVGAALVRDPRVDAVAFTGSAPVGLEIMALTAQLAPAQGHFKHVVAELGGKNCVIVDSDADLDEAVPAIVRSAYAYAGQKCSAASRVLVHEAIAELLQERLAGAIATLQIGQADTFGVDVGPLIEREATERVQNYLGIAQGEGQLLAGCAEALPAHGWFCAPSLVGGLPEDSRVLHEEIFGPLLAIEPVADVEEALSRVERLPFALTGGLFARNPRTVEYVAARSPVGNLYVNRHITGAMVGRQPFGGNRLSGVGAKAGGPDYLLEFVESRIVSENVVRHGLVV
jgi:RHH-type transcriptional regulator, proline utilization regulon repressor / proline dehydrogenase / delta 1-pyrroline-5-carboxylate dehydrogenase